MIVIAKNHQVRPYVFNIFQNIVISARIDVVEANVLVSLEMGLHDKKHF